MIVMPANSTGWFWHCLARETGRIGHLFSPRAQTGPFPWFPYALDNGAFSCWDMKTNTFDEAKWDSMEQQWKELLFWAQASEIKPRWAVVPDTIGNCQKTVEKWNKYASFVTDFGIKPAIAVQDGMTPEIVRSLKIRPSVIFVGGTTDWKWETAPMWIREFDRVHVARVNSPEKLYMLEQLGAESCDGTGWNRGDRKQTEGLEVWARSKAHSTTQCLLSKYTCKKPKKGQTFFA